MGFGALVDPSLNSTLMAGPVPAALGNLPRLAVLELALNDRGA